LSPSREAIHLIGPLFSLQKGWPDKREIHLKILNLALLVMAFDERGHIRWMASLDFRGAI
jgi:hypothetical protein